MNNRWNVIRLGKAQEYSCAFKIGKSFFHCPSLFALRSDISQIQPDITPINLSRGRRTIYTGVAPLSLYYHPHVYRDVPAERLYSGTHTKSGSITPAIKSACFANKQKNGTQLAKRSKSWVSVVGCQLGHTNICCTPKYAALSSRRFENFWQD